MLAQNVTENNGTVQFFHIHRSVRNLWECINTGTKLSIPKFQVILS